MTLREEVLLALENKKGEWMVGKQVKRSLAEKYEANPSPKNSYRIIAPADLLSPNEVYP